MIYLNKVDTEAIINQIRESKLFIEDLGQDRFKFLGNTSQYRMCASFKLKETIFYLELFQIIDYSNQEKYFGCIEKRGKLIWESYDFFEMVEELNPDLQGKLLFHLNLVSKINETRYEFRK